MRMMKLEVLYNTNMCTHTCINLSLPLENQHMHYGIC